MAGTKNRKKSSGSTTTDNNNNANNSDEKELNTQLDRALAAVMKNQYTVSELHKQWRLHILRLSYLVIVLTFHQCQLPIPNCIKQIKVSRLLNEMVSGLIQMYSRFAPSVLIFSLPPSCANLKPCQTFPLPFLIL